MPSSMQNTLPSGTPFVGTQDCFDPAVIVDFVYPDSSRFRKCLSYCKRCTGSSDCQLCGSISNPSLTLYLIQNTSPHKCVQSCVIADYRYQLPAGGQACLQCSSTTFYVKDSSPAECNSCDTSGYSKHGTLCIKCPATCASCDADGKCLSCSNTAHFIQVDLGSCSPGCGNREKEMVVSGQPNKCEACPMGCSTCTQANGCTQCLTDHYGNPNPATSCVQCPTGCATCSSGSECLTCTDPALYLQTDKLTCSAGCGSREYQDSADMKCKACTSNCQACSQNEGCTSCDSGYFESSGTCTQCPNGCATCSSSSQCLTCTDPTYFLKKDQITCSINEGHLRNTLHGSPEHWP